MARKIRRSNTKIKFLVCGKRTIKPEEAALLNNVFGEKIVVGPCVLRLFFSNISFLDRVTASSRQYIRIRYKETPNSPTLSTKHIRGPCSCFVLPSYYEIQVKDLIILRDQDILRRTTAYGESFICGPLMYMPEIIDESLEVLKKNLVDSAHPSPYRTEAMYKAHPIIDSVLENGVTYKATVHQYIRIIHKDTSIDHIRGPYETVHYTKSSYTIDRIQVLDLISLNSGDELYRMSPTSSSFIQGPCEYMPETNDQCGIMYRNGVKYMTVFFFDDKVDWNDPDLHNYRKLRQLEFYRGGQQHQCPINSAHLGSRIVSSVKGVLEHRRASAKVTFRESNEESDEEEFIPLTNNSIVKTTHLMPSEERSKPVTALSETSRRTYHQQSNLKRVNSFNMDFQQTSDGRAACIHMFDF